MDLAMGWHTARHDRTAYPWFPTHREVNPERVAFSGPCQRSDSALLA